MEVFVGLDGGSMVSIFPEGSLPAFALVVFLRSATRDELHALSDYVLSRASDQEMNVIRRHDVVKHTKTEALLGLEDPVKVTAPVARKLEKKLLLMTAVGDVPDGNLAGNSGWRAASCLLRSHFLTSKSGL